MLSLFIISSFFGGINHLFTVLLANPANIIWIFALLGLFIFCETGLVVLPFLPGDSLLFFVGSLAALSQGRLSIVLLIVSMGLIAFLANVVNYTIGSIFGKAIPQHRLLNKLLKPKYLLRAQDFFDKWGAWAIFLGRFMPIIRTIVPFTAGTGKMPKRKFLFFNLLGGFAWVTVTLGAGYFFGQVPLIKQHLELMMAAIVIISLLPAALMGLHSFFHKNKLEYD